VKTSKQTCLLVAAALVVATIVCPVRSSAKTAAHWSIQVEKVDSGVSSLPPSFQVAIYENLLSELSKIKQFQQVFRDGDRNSWNSTQVLLLKTSVQKYTPGSETRRDVTTVSGATKLRVRTQLSTPDGKVIADRTVNGNVRFLGSNLRATHNLARNVAKVIKKTPLPEPPASEAARSALSGDVVVVEVR
jgi:hypothetical protein